ncbi:MAG TPA: FUSC family protein [Aliidongia sp.]|uniref:FUSC family protein n=1 Tax=Aliidongia sp. TaxID=1914230 RepID=UPI002DDCE721|nr:FUSC family protein [Aliidongia sp.]HEV2678561.1 FUSC family protein [Aliidongia sp.]
MDGLARGRAPRDWRSRLDRVLPLDLREISLAAGTRAATASALPVLAGELLHKPELNWIAIIGFWTCLADVGGSNRTRSLSMGSFTLFAALGNLVSYFVQDSTPLAVLLVLLWSFSASMGRLFGNAATTVGVLLTTDVLVSIGIPDADWRTALARAALTVAGGLWAMALALILWPVHPNAASRRAIAACWRSVADYAAALGQMHGRADPSEAEWGRLVRERRNHVRTAIEAARATLAGTRRRTPGESDRGAGLVILAAEIDQIFAALIALSEVLELASALDRHPDIHFQVDAALSRLAAIALDLGEAMTGGPLPPAADLSVAARGLRRAVEASAPRGTADLAAYRQAGGLIETIGGYVTHAASTIRGVAPDAPPPIAPEQLQAVAPPERGPRFMDFIDTLRANLNFQSITFRHALRLAITAAAAVALTRSMGLTRGYWLTITAAVVLQPYLATTFRRTVERVVGSVAGGLVAALLGWMLPDPIAITIVIFPLAIASMALRPVNYTLFVFLLTPQFVLVAELFQTGGNGDFYLASLRAMHSLLGGALGLAAAYLLWPVREGLELPRQLARAVRTNRDLAAASLDLFLSGEAGRELGAPRQAAGMASNNAEASLQRLIDEPHTGTRREEEPATTILTCLRRLAGVALTLAHLPPGLVEAEDKSRLEQLRDWLGSCLSAIGDAIERRVAPSDLPPSPELPALGPEPAAEPTTERQLLDHEFARLTRQVHVLHAAAIRLAGF